MANSKDATSNAGFYYICYRLSVLGLILTPSSASPRGRILTVRHPESGLQTKIKVKAVSKSLAAGFGPNPPDFTLFDFVSVVNLADPLQPISYILETSYVRQKINHDSAYWLEIRDYELKEFRENWSRVLDSLAG